MKYIKYLGYLLKHKWFVLVECFKVGEYWRGITHDMSKFLPDEFIPYAKYFYGDYRSIHDFPIGCKFNYFGIYKEDIEREFNVAWLKHIHRNPHHWQYWILKEDSGKEKILEMPINYKTEMLADWRGAGRAIHGKDDTKEWYLKNRGKIKISKNTRTFIDSILDIKKK